MFQHLVFIFSKINFLSKNQYSSYPVNLLNFILTKQSHILLSHPAHLAALQGRCCCLQWTHCWGLDGPQGCLAPSSGWTGTWTQVQVGWSGIQSPFDCAKGSSWVLFSLVFLLKRNPSPGLQAWLPPTSLCCPPCPQAAGHFGPWASLALSRSFCLSPSFRVDLSSFSSFLLPLVQAPVSQTKVKVFLALPPLPHYILS